MRWFFDGQSLAVSIDRGALRIEPKEIVSTQLLADIKESLDELKRGDYISSLEQSRSLIRKCAKNREIRFTAKAQKQYAELPHVIQKKTDKQLGYLLQDYRHPSLNAKRYYEATGDLWQG